MTSRLAVALNDLAESFDRAIRKAASPKIARALCSLRDEAEGKLRRAADGFGKRAPSEIIAETLDRLGDIVGGIAVQRIAKAAPAEMTEDEKTKALLDLGKRFAELAEKWKLLFGRIGAKDEFERWRKQNAEELANHARTGDLTSAQLVLDHAAQAISSLYHAAQRAHAFAGKAAEADANRFPYSWMNG